MLYNTPGSLPTFSTITCFSLSGMIAGLAASPIACTPLYLGSGIDIWLFLTNIFEIGPFELAKNVVQTSVLMANRSHATPGSTDKNVSLRGVPRLGTLQAINQIVSRHGFRGLYTGVQLHALRDTIGTGMYFGIYETVKQLMSTHLGENRSPLGATLAAGAICGVIPWICVSALPWLFSVYYINHALHWTITDNLASC